MDLIEENKDFIKGKLYRVKDTKHWMFCRYNSNEVISCRANAFLFYEEKEDFYLFYSVSEKALIRTSKPWAAASMKKVQ